MTRERGAETVTVTGIAAGGAGVARLEDGRVAFIQRTSPGDRVDVRVTVAKPRWARARLVRVLEAGSDRRDPPCPLYDRCGGCTLQHMAYDAQVAVKAQIVHDAFSRIGGIEIARPDVDAAPAEFEYRNRVTLHLRRLDGDRVIAGFHELERSDRILDVDGGCLLPEPSIREAWRLLRQNWGSNAHRLPAGESLRLTLQAGETGQVGLLIEDGFGDGRPQEILDRVSGIFSIWKSDHAGIPRPLAERDRSQADDGSDVRAGVFTQVNRQVARRLEQHVRTLLGAVDGQRIIDAYCGIGTRSADLARAGAAVTGIEVDTRAVEEARSRVGARAAIDEGLVEERLPTLLPADVVILNPPRAGLDRAVCETLLERPPRRIIYVSCDSATLARDCARLRERFTIMDVRCFDMFPQTSHVESVADLRCDTT